MDKDSIKFDIVNKEGNIIECEILSIFPLENSEAYVVFIDGEKDENSNYIFKYGKILKNNDEYELKAGVSELELSYIQENFYKEIFELSQKIIESRS